MDGRRFDRFVATLGQTTTRRQWIKTCAAGILAAAVGVSRKSASAQDDPATDREATPLPNFPFLAVMPTDNRFSAYAVDERLTGPPSRYRSIEAMTALPDDWRAILRDDFQCAYAVTIAAPRSDNQREPARAVTTVIFDLGSEDAADQAHADYVSSLFSSPTLATLDSNVSDGRQVVLGGCEGGCFDLQSPVPSNTESSSELAVVGRHGQFVFDARVRTFSDDPLDIAGGEAVARLINNRLQGVTALTTGTSASMSRSEAVARFIDKRFAGVTALAVGSSAAPGQPGDGWMQRFSAALRNRQAQSVAQSANDELRDALASRNTLPIFDLGSGDPPLSATQTLVVDDGAIVIQFGESPASAAARQRSAEDVVFACGTDQPLPIADAYHDGYDLFLSTIQYVFGNEADAVEFLGKTRDRLQRDRPQLVLTEVSTTDDEVRDVFQDGRESRGFSFGCQSHQILRLGSIAAVLAVEASAKPRSPDQPPIEADDLENELCSIVDQSAEKFILCIVSPDECQSAFPLTMPDAMQPTPTPGSTCNQPQTMCNGQCVDTSQNISHCGSCGFACAQGYSCIGGRCQCGPGQTDCGGFCADLNADGNNCGRCGATCGSNAFCSGGVCACTSGQPPCGGTVCCDPSMSCVNGTCAATCGGSQIDCSGICVDPMWDPVNCGYCGNVCSSGTCCSGTCVDPGSDPYHCGGCGQSCAGGCCGGVCADFSSDPWNCGGCGQSCGGGSCCGGYCTDTSTDGYNCGACGNVCNSYTCQGSTCYSD